ncbi:MAG: zinc-ribbon domain-containing protein [Lachnospiraceae bacterium]|nr:zinc-ribbon domain-containing protein [Lachnospiraceae bacterium]
MYCSKCGKEIPDTAKFCAVCGAPVIENGQSDVPLEAEAQDNRKHTKQVMGIGIISALAVMIMGGLLFYTNRNPVRTDQTEPVLIETQPSESENVAEPEAVFHTGFVTQNGELYYYDTNGELTKGWFEENGSRYFAADEGRIYRNGSFEIDGVQYIFDGEGRCIGDERTFAEEDANLWQSLNAGSSLAGLMTVLAEGYIGDGRVYDDSTTSETVQADINRLLNGEPEGIERFFGGDITMAQCLRYTLENQPSNIEELCQQYGNHYYLTKEQMEYLVYSVCGKQIDIDMSQDSSWHEPYLGLGGDAGYVSWNELRNFSVGRVDADTWQVRADVYFGEDVWLTYIQAYVESVAEICFTVIRNPDSYFDGYSIARAEVELTGEDTAWRYYYTTYIEDFEQRINSQIDEYVLEYGLSAQGVADMRTSIQYDLIYIDDDDIPELYIEYPVDPPFQKARIITYYDGQLVDSGDEYDWSSCEYIEGSGLCYGEFDRMSLHRSGVYKLENGKWQMQGSGSGQGHSFPYFEWNGTEVSSYEEIERNIDALYDRAHSSKCGKSMSALEVIKLIYQDAELIFYDDEYYAGLNDPPVETASNESAPNGIVSNGIRYFTNNDEFEAALTQEQYDQWVQLAGPNIYAQFGGQLYFEGFDGVELRASYGTVRVTVTYGNLGISISVQN